MGDKLASESIGHRTPRKIAKEKGADKSGFDDGGMSYEHGTGGNLPSKISGGKYKESNEGAPPKSAPLAHPTKSPVK